MRNHQLLTLLAGAALALLTCSSALAANGGGSNATGSQPAGAATTALPGQQYLNQFQNSLANNGVAKHLPPGFTDGPSSHDLTYRMIRRLLGDPAVQALGYFHKHDNKPGGITAITLTLGLFPFIAMFVSSILIMYWITTGMFLTTATGELLGKKWETWSMPIRSSVSYAMLWPLPGFAPLSGVQVAILVLSFLGIGAGSAFFAKVSQFLISTPLIMVQNADAPTFVNSVARSELCLAIGVQNGVFSPKEAALTAHPVKSRFASSIALGGADPDLHKTRTRYDFGPDGACGSFTLETPARRSPATSLSDKVSRQIRKQLSDARPGILRKVIVLTKRDLIAPLVSGTVNKSTDQYAATYNQLVGALNRRINAALAGLRQKPTGAMTALGEALSRNGFAAAGTVYWTLERRQDAFVNAMNDFLPDVSQPIYGKSQSSWWPTRWFGDHQSDQPLARAYLAKRSVLDSANQRYHEVYTPRGSLDAFYDKTTPEGTVSKGMSIAANWLAENIVKIPRIGTSSSEANPDPMMEVKMLGQQLQDAVAAFEGARLLAGVIGGPEASVAKKVLGGGGGGFMGWVTNIILMLALGLGFFYANILPMMPYIMWTAAMIGYLVYLLEALVAGNFWFAMKAHPDGEGLVGRASSGYPILLTLVLYPVLMVTGFVFGMGITRVGGWLINTTLWTAFEDMSTDGFNLLSIVGKLAVYAIVYLILLYKGFAVTSELPQGIMRWMGVGTHFTNLGEDQAKSQAENIASRVTAGIGRSIGGGAMRGAAA